MTINFITIQLIGVLAWLMLVQSFYRKNTDSILSFQIIATILYCLHYLLLGAYSGLFICTLETIRDTMYYKTDWDDTIFKCTIPIYILGGVFSVKTLVDVFPVVASAIDGYGLTKEKDLLIFWAVIEYVLWVIYDIVVMSYSTAITDGIVALSNLSILIFGKTFIKNEAIKKM